MKDEINPFIVKNIRYLRKKHEMGQEKLADMTGFKSFTTIQKWGAGDSEPSVKTAKQIADIFNVRLNDLVSIDLETAPDYQSSGIRIPVLGRVAAGIPIEAIEEIIDYEEIARRI